MTQITEDEVLTVALKGFHILPLSPECIDMDQVHLLLTEVLKTIKPPCTFKTATLQRKCNVRTVWHIYFLLGRLMNKQCGHLPLGQWS